MGLITCPEVDISVRPAGTICVLDDGTIPPTRSTNLPCLDSSYLPTGDKEVIPTVGMIFNSLDEGESFYREYASWAGFDVRRGSDTKKKDVITWKLFVCSRASMRDTSTVERKYHRKLTRYGCQAMIALKKMADGKYEVTKFQEVHSHALVSPSKKQFLKSCRHVDATCDKVNIGPSKAYHILKEQVGGYSYIGCTQKDLQNFQTGLKTLIKDSDAQIFVDTLKSRKESDPGFFYATQLDDQQRLRNIFWADGICRKNYALVGDVVSFDSTYDTNKYNMIFAPFTGVNHHMSCISFGVALLANEKVETYAWLFDTFSEAVGGIQHRLIVTDEDPSMKAAIDRVFKHSKHRLCMWHILKKLPEKVGGVLWSNSLFQNKFLASVWNFEAPRF